MMAGSKLFSTLILLFVKNSQINIRKAANKDRRPAQKIGCKPSFTTFITTWLYPEINEKKQRPAMPNVSRFLDSIFNLLNKN